jgi:hypothetical protein
MFVMKLLINIEKRMDKPDIACLGILTVGAHFVRM